MDERSEEYRRLEKEYEFLSNLINSHRNKKSSQAEELEALPRSGFSVAKGSSPKQSQSQLTVSISRRNRPQRGGIGSDKINPLQCLATNEKSQQCLDLQKLDKGHQYVKKNIGHSDQLYAINKYKLVRPHSETSLPVSSGCQSSQTHVDCANEKLVKPSSLLCNSTKLLNSCHSAKDVIVHKSKYKLVKSDHAATDVSMTTLKSSQNLTKNIDYKNGTFSSTTGFGAVKGRLGRASSGSVTAPVASPYKTVKRSITMSLGSRHQMRKANKMPMNSLLPKGQFGRNAYAANSSRTLFANSRPKGSWITKYSLQRQHGEVRNQDNCINMILGRKVSNLSSNKYKFINARPVRSPKSSSRYTFKRKLLTNDRLPSSKSARYSWHPRYRLTVRKLNYSDLRRPLKRRKNFPHNSTETRAGDVGVRYCLYYNRFGRCSRGDSCQFIHDPDKISVCTRFLRGTCKITDCPFSHTVAKHKMPTCRFFMRRACHREDCPYLHVNVGKDAEICLDFPRGLCTNGDLCKKKHMLICLDFSDNGTCPRGSSCPLLHPKKQQKPDVCKKVATKPQCSLASADKAGSITSVNALRDPGESSLPDDDVTLEWKERRLPSFIALNNSVENSPHQSTVSESGNSKCLIIHPRLKTYDARIKMVESIIQQSSQDL